MWLYELSVDLNSKSNTLLNISVIQWNTRYQCYFNRHAICGCSFRAPSGYITDIKQSRPVSLADINIRQRQPTARHTLHMWAGNTLRGTHVTHLYGERTIGHCHAESGLFHCVKYYISIVSFMAYLRHFQAQI